MTGLQSFSLGAALLALVTCSAEKNKPELQPGPELRSGSQGLMNFRQLRAAWAFATGLDPHSLPLESAFKDLQDRLLATNAPDQLTQPTVTASIALGAAFCNHLVDRESKIEASDRRFFNALSLDREPDEAGLKSAAERLARALWRRPLKNEEAAEFVSLGRDVYRMGMQKPKATRLSAGRESWLSLCTAAGAAVDALTL